MCSVVRVSILYVCLTDASVYLAGGGIALLLAWMAAGMIHLVQHVHVGTRRDDTPRHGGVADLGWLGLQPLRDKPLAIKVLTPVLLVVVAFLQPKNV